MPFIYFFRHFVLKNKIRGYTFIELMLSAIILLTIIAISTPILSKTYYDLRYNLQTKDLISFFNLARERSIATRLTHFIKIGKDNKSYRMLGLDEKEQKPVALKERWGREVNLYSDLTIVSSAEIIAFYPDGSSSGAEINIKDKNKIVEFIKIDPVSGKALIEKK